MTVKPTQVVVKLNKMWMVVELYHELFYCNRLGKCCWAKFAMSKVSSDEQGKVVWIATIEINITTNRQQFVVSQKVATTIWSLLWVEKCNKAMAMIKKLGQSLQWQ